MSRATLIRRLKQEGTQYREVLAEVRLNHALFLIQNGSYNVALLANRVDINPRVDSANASKENLVYHLETILRQWQSKLANRTYNVIPLTL